MDFKSKNKEKLQQIYDKLSELVIKDQLTNKEYIGFANVLIEIYSALEN